MRGYIEEIEGFVEVEDALFVLLGLEEEDGFFAGLVEIEFEFFWVDDKGTWVFEEEDGVVGVGLVAVGVAIIIH